MQEPLELPKFDIVSVGVGCHFEAVPLVKDSSSAPTRDYEVTLPLCSVPIGLPPVFPDPASQLEESFLLHPEKLDIHNFEHTQRFWVRTPKPESLYHLHPGPSQSTIVVDRNPTTGQLLGFKEEFITDSDSTAENSTSMKRAPGPPAKNVQGSSTSYPFWPGGLEEPNLDPLKDLGTFSALDLDKDLLSVPPGFSSGMDFKMAPSRTISEFLKSVEKSSVVSILDIFSGGEDLIDIGQDSASSRMEGLNSEKLGVEKSDQKLKERGMAISSDETKIRDDILKIGDVPSLIVPRVAGALTEEPAEEEWAVQLDVSAPINDFNARIPKMAYKWDFELDTFQKQAILCLEQHRNVFVAAHTSAGKTVVAEYAIALSLKHMTKTVYTSPIKALSNQKYREFRKTFDDDVGLITGDVQIKPEASCLVMTTEILRSMLYNGSEVIRDLEWVIFDEVHYINDPERGVVWEEVIIMLPAHVNIVLLSATVPNTMEFAGWIGRIKKKKVPTATLR